LLSSICVTDLACANFFDLFPVPSMKIVSAPYPQNEYENSTLPLEIHVYMLDDSPRLRSISYILDEEPTVYLYNHTSSGGKDFGLGRTGYTVSAKVDIENLSEGNHTVRAFAIDINGKEMSTSQNFTVNSHYQVTVLSVLSPTNITYFAKEMPLIFTVNGELENATFLSIEPLITDGVRFGGNSTLTGLSDGFHKAFFTVNTEKGKATALLSFTINSTQFNNPIDLENPLILLSVITTY
jgi:hypothetical protein